MALGRRGWGEGNVEAKIVDPKEVHILTPGTCKYVPFHDKKAFAAVTERLSGIIRVGPA